MKAERRHELKTNTLAHGLEGLPEFWRRYGTKVLLGLVAVLAIVLFVRFQASDARQRAEAAGEAFAGARSGINNLRNLGSNPDGKAAADQRRDLVAQTSQAIQQVLDESKDDAMRAEALVARGDLNWYLATGPEIPGADTQPSLRLEEKDAELLEKARAAYEQSAQTSGATPLTLVTARLGLAAVAEQREQWDEARKHYEQIAGDARTPEAFKNHARVRIEDLKDLDKPVLIGSPATAPSDEPTTTTAPTTGPATTTTTTPAPEPTPDPEQAPELEPIPDPDQAPAPEPTTDPEQAPEPEPAPAPAPQESGEARQ